MSSKRKRLANRLNAQKSTGPRTPEGKARSSKNALKHGFFAREVLIPEENAEEFTDFVREMRRDLKPVGSLEEVIASQVTAGAWRLKRLARIEAGVFTDLLSGTRRRWINENHYSSKTPKGDPLPPIPEEVIWGRILETTPHGGDPLDKLSRYQTLVTRDFYRALRELNRLQATRPATDWLDDTADMIPVVQNEPTDLKTAPAPPPPGSGGGRGVGPVESAAPKVQNEPTDLKTTPPTDHRSPATGHCSQNEPMSREDHYFSMLQHYPATVVQTIIAQETRT
ncbi:MAG: hypothetical protein ACYC7E_19820 [Armatimonadota bacterium]